MSKILNFSIGVIAGIYLDQNYKIPTIKVLFENALKYIEEYEKDNRKK